MKKTFSLLGLSVMMTLSAQNISEQLAKATQQLLSQPKMYAAQLSFYVADDAGNFIYEYQGNKGLSTASTQKLFTAAAALELLGKDYRYQTTMAYDGNLRDGVLHGNLYLRSNGDPTLGSWRYEGFQPQDFLSKMSQALAHQGIQSIEGDLIIDDCFFDFQTIPGGWSWNDLGNYYGAGVWGVNWRENQFDLHIQGGSQAGKPTQFKGFSYPLVGVSWVNETTSGSPKSGDQSYIYTAPHSPVAYINGSLPAGKTTTVSGAVPNPPLQLGTEILKTLQSAHISFSGQLKTTSQQRIQQQVVASFPEASIFFTYNSPPLEKIVYWFLRKSVNLYGETLVKTIGMQQNHRSDFGSSVALLQDFWKNKGIRTAMINFADGSGLSPQNYASARAEVQALVWSKKQAWFPTFYEALPIYNGMKMKSGTIKSTKAYAGYHTSKSGKHYIFSIIVNNYEGSSINAELFKVLDVLK
ncbi:D-alanyl-D-alanine carboxypeptidase/D-alanyl-D-alanine endopeptidase [Riemerella columbina]|uniref:D-alanyl-D-alanine carboxypeptidase/D-alanyl-D-alanine endopeptidase n=1 Tax=Riemerella columbina TaxID=103810 RepID=UPI00266F2028|nr:D-alanyl-D-alanine carboxypeptidase/D-alanyl-D-alanine-endopeptidase [Riemerella columbina]WKS94509.1 D-alanyl-D-alanine carboxypeptidase/D-alanyl-D-alanine-endopeptidase [Riemerella columbina]